MRPISTRLLLLACLAATPASGVGLPAQPSTAVAIDSSMALSGDQLSALSQAALAGDPDAAFRMFLNFALPGDARDTANRWLRIAAENGHPIAQYNLWFQLKDSKDGDDRRRSIFWLRRSAQAGYAPATKELRSDAE